jgi:ubiquinone/menaquinone biosynthesis C-methylase UbiE
MLSMAENLDLIYEVFGDLPRGSPGSRETTKKAYLMLKPVPSHLRILDVGCGPGMQTLELARISGGQIIALDVYQPFLNKITQRAAEEGLAERVRTVNKSMLEMDFAEGSFDVIWAEGSIFIQGFEKGLREWRKFIAKTGYLVVSELAWLKENPPEEPFKFFTAEYPQMQMHEGNLKIIGNVGYRLINNFVFPKSDWLNYYNPVEIKLAALRKKYHGNQEATNFLDLILKEITIYNKYSKYYGYIFYLMQNK